MGLQLCQQYPEIKARYFDNADQVLGFRLSELCYSGPEDQLVLTENQQPAIYTVSCAICAVLTGAGLRARAFAGHSLGEYSALVAAGAISFEEGLRLTRRRGELMGEVARSSGGIMAAILGLPAEQVERVCHDAAGAGVVEVANYNSPTQTVISGNEPAVRRAMELAKEAGAQRVVPLNVSAPFHCSLMAPVATTFGQTLGRTAVQGMGVPVVANVTADYEWSGNEIRQNLTRQIDSPVRWTDSMQRLLADGFDTFVEVGPGRVLSGLMRQTAPDATTYSTNDPAGIDKTVDQIRDS